MRSLEVFRGIELSEPLTGSVSRTHHQLGETIFPIGSPPDAVYFVLEGEVRLVRDREGRPETLSSVGAGQCFGELGVLRSRPRGATAVAATQVSLLRIEAQTFRRWHREHPQLRDFLGTLEQVYKRGDGRRLSVFRGEIDRSPTIGTVSGDPDGDCIVSTRVIGQDVLMLARGGVTVERTERFDDERSGMRRELSLGAVEQQGGRLISAEIVGVVAKAIRPDVGELVRHVHDRLRVPASALARFRRTGHLGGTVQLRDPSRLCGCMRLGHADLLRAAEEHGATLEAIRAATGVTLLCGACEPDVCAALASAPSVATRGPSPATPPPAEDPARPAPRVSRLDVRFDPEALEALRGVPELHLMAVASVFATTGERIMIRAISRALPSIQDQTLVGHAEAFLAQEANHIAAHAPLNVLLLERIYPTSRALARLASSSSSRLDRLPLRVALSMCAAFECAADVAFETFFDRYYAEGGPHVHPDPEVYELSIRSGIAALFHWHGAEELGHRHVAFDVMRAVRTPYPVRALGFLIFAVLSLVMLLPALWSLRRFASRPLAMAPPGTTVRILTRALAFLDPRFHPGHRRYGFADQLERDARRYPSP